MTCRSTDILDTIDIIDIDSKIKKAFADEEGNLDDYRKKLADLSLTLENGNLSYRSRKTVIEASKELKDTIERIETKQSLHFYVMETAHFVVTYENMLKIPIKISFTGKRTKKDPRKNKLIKEYLDVVQRYVNEGLDIGINLPQIHTKNSEWIDCDNCDNKSDFDIINGSVYICNDCGSERELKLHTSSYKDVDRINISGKYTYERRVHFSDCIKQYMGKENSSINQKVYDDLEDQFDRHGLLSGDKSTPKEVRFSKVTKEHVYMFLKELRYTKRYENVNLIHHKMTGKKPDDISYLENSLMENFDTLAEEYDKTFKNDPEFYRKNFINNQCTLYQLLIKHGHPCKKNNFSILKTTDRRAFHDEITETLFVNLGWNFKVSLF